MKHRISQTTAQKDNIKGKWQKNQTYSKNKKKNTQTNQKKQTKTKPPTKNQPNNKANKQTTEHLEMKM